MKTKSSPQTIPDPKIIDLKPHLEAAERERRAKAAGEVAALAAHLHPKK